MVQPSLFVTRRLPRAVEAGLAERFHLTLNKGDQPLAAEDLREAVSRFDAVLPTVTDRFCQRALDTRPQAKILANYGVGYSHIDMHSVSRHGIAVTNTPDVLSECTADLAVMLMLMVARRAGDGERELRAGRWAGWTPTHLLGTKVSGKTLGIIGFGRIGQEVARRAHYGFGMNVVVYNRSPIPADRLAATGARQADSIDALLPECDFVSLHCPGGAQNRHLMNGRRFDLMREGAYLINTARGEVVDEHALEQALTFGVIGGAALDVFDAEPRINPALRDLDNLVMLPHLGSATTEAREAMGFRAMDNLVDFFEGREPRDRVA